MGLFRNKDSTPPDVGKETYLYPEGVTEINPNDIPVYAEPSGIQPQMYRNQINQNPNYPMPLQNFELEKLNAKLEMNNALIKGFNERLSLINQQIGEIRTMSLQNEKNISKSTIDAQKAVEIVKEVAPEKLRIDYQKIEIKVTTLSEKLESYNQYIASIIEELKELKRKAGVFEGSEAILRLNEDVKKDLIEAQKMSARVKMNADKCEQIFIELKKGFIENERNSEIVSNLNNSYSDLRKEIERLNIEHKQIISAGEFADFMKKINSKITAIQNSFIEVEKIKQENEIIKQMINNTLLMQKANEDSIKEIKVNAGNDNFRKIQDYEKKFVSMLSILDKMAFEIKKLKEKTEVNSTKTTENSEPEKTSNSKIDEIKRTMELEDSEYKGENNMIIQPKKTGNTKKQIIDTESKINELLLNGGYFLVKGDFENAKKIYKEISESYNPANDRNKSLYYKIMRFYDNIQSLSNNSITVKEE